MKLRIWFFLTFGCGPWIAFVVLLLLWRNGSLTTYQLGIIFQMFAVSPLLVELRTSFRRFLGRSIDELNWIELDVRNIVHRWGWKRFTAWFDHSRRATGWADTFLYGSAAIFFIVGLTFQLTAA